MAVEVGDHAPDFELKDQHGTPVRLSSFRGVKHVVLTHISDELDELWARREGEAGFGAPVEIAKEGAVYRL